MVAASRGYDNFRFEKLSKVYMRFSKRDGNTLGDSEFFLDMKVSRYCEGYSLWSIILQKLHNTSIPQYLDKKLGETPRIHTPNPASSDLVSIQDLITGKLEQNSLDLKYTPFFNI